MSEPIVWTNCQVRLGELKRWEDNPAEIGKEAAGRLVDSFNEFGQVETLAIDPDNMLIDGHQRLDVWQAKFGSDMLVDCRRSSRLLSLQERQKIAVYLRSGAVGRYNWDAIANWDADDLQAWGFDSKTLDDWQTDVRALSNFLDSNEEEPKDAEPQIDRAAELNEKWQVKTGDLWQIGEHRLLCGDSTVKVDVDRVMGGEKALIMATDPPYGVDLDQSWRDEALGDRAMGPGNKHVVDNDSRCDWSEAWKLFSGDICYVWHASRFSDVVMESLRSAGFEICQQLIWNKSIMVMGRSDYHFKHEPCWYAVRKGKSHSWTGDRTNTTVIDAKSPNHIMSGSKEEKTEHPTQKPIDCFSMIGNHGKDGDIVYEPFCGSGTTMVACENLHRKCRAIEISPNYCAVILERMATAFPDLIIEKVQNDNRTL